MFCDTDLQLAESDFQDEISSDSLAVIHNGSQSSATPLEVLPIGLSTLDDDAAACNIHALVSTRDPTNAVVPIGPNAPETEIVRVRFADHSNQSEDAVIIIELPAVYQAQWTSQDPAAVDAFIAKIVKRGRLLFESDKNSDGIPLMLFNAFMQQVPKQILKSVVHVAIDTGSGKKVDYQTLLAFCAKARSMPALSILDLCLYGDPSACSRFTWPDLTPSIWVYKGATYDDWDAEAEVKSYQPSKQELAVVFKYLENEHGEMVADHLLDATREALRSFHWDRIKITSMTGSHNGDSRLLGTKQQLRLT